MNEKYNVIIVDDEYLAQKLLQDYVSKVESLQLVATCSNAFEAMEALKQYQWTGNIRELRNIVERLVILCGSDITKDDVVRFGNPLN